MRTLVFHETVLFYETILFRVCSISHCFHTSDWSQHVEELFHHTFSATLVMYISSTPQIRCQLYPCLIWYIFNHIVQITLAGENLKSWVHVPKKKLMISFTEIFQSPYKWLKNGQKIALCCNISKWDVF